MIVTWSSFGFIWRLFWSSATRWTSFFFPPFALYFHLFLPMSFSSPFFLSFLPPDNYLDLSDTLEQALLTCLVMLKDKKDTHHSVHSVSSKLC